MDNYFRYPLIVRIAIAALFAFVLMSLANTDENGLSFLIHFVLLLVYWESQYRFLAYSYRQVVFQRQIIQLMYVVVFSIAYYLLLLLTLLFLGKLSVYKDEALIHILFYGSIAVFHLLLITLRQLEYQRYRELREKKLSLEEKYKAIKSKSILHFLQNSLQATQKLIALDPQKAHQQIETLTKLLRSLLQSRDKDFISLKEESDLVKEFVQLLELQGNVKIVFSIENDKKYEDYQIPPFVLILIFDNIFENRSFIPYAELQVYVENGIYLVAKYKQLRKYAFVDKQDKLLKNLKQRYFFTRQETNVVMIPTQSHTFIKVPLLPPPEE